MPALIFDCDGVLADTERFGHLPAYNATFADAGLDFSWSDAEYAVWVRIGGGKERMRALLTEEFVRRHGLPADPEAQDELIRRWHRHKTDRYIALVRDGGLSARPGVIRIATEALAAGWDLAVASTSAEESVRAVAETVLGAEITRHLHIFAGDIVAAKKPAPDVYVLALQQLGVDARDAIVVEDSAIGVRAATGAGLACVVTVAAYTAEQDFTGAALVTSCLGDDHSPCHVLDNPRHLPVPGRRGRISVADLAKIIESRPAES